MRVHVVCRLNQARSIIAAGALRQLYPDILFFSSGIQAQSGKPIPQIITEIADCWNIELLDHVSMQFGEREDIREGDFILAADSGICEYLSSLSLPGILLDVSSFAPIDFLSPEDPLNMSFESTQLEISKMILASSRVLESITSTPPIGQINSILSLGSDEQLFRQIPKMGSECLLIDMNLSVPDSTLWTSKGYQVAYFNHRNLELDSILNEESDVLVSRYEVENPSAFLLSRKWLDFLEEKASKKPITLIVRPLASSSNLAPETILALLHCRTVELLVP